ncbi:MAG: hypothetical protein HPY85_08975 [Anaerolineae bacterium]|nr:hypothetical protein [Anaerolineae bacterium]
MRKFLAFTGWGFLGITVIILLFLGIQSLRLHWWTSPGNDPLPELTQDQKMEDMRYLLMLTEKVTMADAVWDAAGMENPLAAQDEWIKRAGETENNREFIDLVLQFLTHVGQGGHAFPAYDANFNPITSLVSDVPRDSFSRTAQWSSIIGSLSWYAHANLPLIYRDGKYLVEVDSQVGDIHLPAGSAVETVDGLPVEEFVLRQQYRTHLRYDPQLEKFFIYPLLGIDPGIAAGGWILTVRLPDGSLQTVVVDRIPGYQAHLPVEAYAANTRCMALTPEVLYIRMLTFAGVNASQDAITLRKCFSEGNYKSAIFDVRGNTGGEIWSYMNNIIAPLIDEPVTYSTTHAVKESFYRWYNWRWWLYRLTNNNELIDPIAHRVSVTRIAQQPYSDQDWRVVQVNRRIEPAADPYSFKGSLYVLADNNTLSAGDSFTAVMQHTGLATVVGTNTVGWGQGYQAKMLYGLPNSGLLIYLDAELTLNADGTINNYQGVMPSVFLEPSQYPSTYPQAFSRDTLLADPWVQWVLSDAEKD